MDWLTFLLAACLAFLGWYALRLRQRLAQQQATVQRTEREWQARLETLSLERARLAAVLSRMTDAVLVADEAGRVTYANRAANELFGEPASGLAGRSVSAALRHHQLIQVWQRSRETGRPQQDTVDLPRRRRFVQITALPDAGGEGALILVQDLTRLRRLEQVRSQFVSDFSHELRTPLASIKALAETLAEGALEDVAAARRFLEHLVREVDAVDRMTQDLLMLARLESGRERLQRRPLSPCEPLRAATARLLPQVTRGGLQLDVRCPANLPLVSVDADSLTRALMNLLHNAIKFTPPGGRVTLSVSLVANRIRWQVRDTGPGILPDDLPHIFERFYKVDRARSGSGSGLGLSIVRHIAESHGGRVWAESAPGQGSVFYLEVPL